MKPPLIFSDGETTTDPLQGVWLYHPEKNVEYESEVIQLLSDPPSEGWLLFSSQEKRDNQLKNHYNEIPGTIEPGDIKAFG